MKPVVSNHYQTLEVSPQATQTEIKQAYRRLVKQFHPDLQLAQATAETGRHSGAQPQNTHDLIAKINAAYEILGDPSQRRAYDQERLHFTQQGLERAAAAQSQHQKRPSSRETDAHLTAWLQQIYRPVNLRIQAILKPLSAQIEDLAADPFDDDLLANFQDYLEDCRAELAKARQCFQSMPNPANFAGVAANLYYCLNQISDGLDDLEMFPLNYDDHYLHTGQELFRIARGLRREAAALVGNLA
jgi:molecular chaperone DnaJ